MHGFAGAIDTAFGPGEKIDRAGSRTPGHTAVGQIKACAGHVEEDIILAFALRRQHRRHHGRRAAHQSGREGGAAIRIRLRRTEDLVVLGKKLQVHTCDRLGRAKRPGKHMQPIRAGIGGETDIGDDKPLGRLVVPFLINGIGSRCREHIDARLALGQRLVDRETGRHVLVHILAEIDRALPDEFAVFLLDPVGAIAAHLGEKLRIGQQRRDIAVADPVEFEVRPVGIDRDDRDAAARGRRQHETVAGKPHHRRAVLDVDVEIDLGRKRLIDRRRQATAKRKLVTLAVG
ncbi:hypothetical protein D3C73_587570 [compost metagenome]